jgi:hypothetical protein
MPYTKGANNTSGSPYAGPGSTASHQQANNWESQYLEAMNSFGPDAVRAFVLSGGVGTIHGGLPKQMDVTQCIYYAFQTADTPQTYRRQVVNATNFTTATPSTTYFLDYNFDGTTSWGTAHSGTPNYVSIASVTTDGSGNISVITDVRPTNLDLFVAAVGRLKFGGSFIPTVGSHSGVTFKVSAGNGAPGTLDANEIYFQLT